MANDLTVDQVAKYVACQQVVSPILKELFEPEPTDDEDEEAQSVPVAGPLAEKYAMQMAGIKNA